MKGKEPSIQWAFPLGSQPGLGGTRRPGRQPPPERPGADSGGQGPFPKAGGSYHQFFPRKAPLWALHSSVPRLPGKGPSWEGGKQALPGQDRASRALWSGGRKCPLALALVTTRMRSPSTVVPMSPPRASAPPPLPLTLAESADSIVGETLLLVALRFLANAPSPSHESHYSASRSSRSPCWGGR